MNRIDEGGLRSATGRTLPKGSWSAESGLRLLIAADGSGDLRWSPDPDGPDMRALAAGEIRLTIRCFRVGAGERSDVLRAGLAARAAAAGRMAWRSIPAVGLAEVTESNSTRSLVGTWRQGRLHVGTYQVVRDDHEEALAVVSPARAALACSGFACGRDAVERLIVAWRDGSHGFDEFGPMSLTSMGSSSAAAAPISVASWHRRQAAVRPRASSKERRLA